jgi:hypothetical protein
MSLFDGIFSAKDGTRAANKSAAAQTNAANAARAGAYGYMDKGVAAATPQYEKAIGLFDEYTQQGGQAAGAYGDAIGLNGQEGYDRATDAFRTGPGYNFAVDQANEAVKRNAAATGMLGSGNTLIGISDRTRGMADQEYQRYLDNLFRASGQGQSAATTQAGLITGLGDFLYGDNAARAALEHGTETSLGQIQAQKYADIAAAKQQASGNIWGAILGVGDLAARFYGGSKPA